MRSHTVISIAVVVSVLIVTLAGLKGCQDANSAFYALASECVRNGGSWVPVRFGDDGLCIDGSRP